MTTKAGAALSQPIENVDEDRTVCFCHNVSVRELKAAIASGANSIEAIQSETCASTGCGGCELEVREILEQELQAATKGGSPVSE
jgi:NAD(P)H-nitrite reductase large subunit